MQKGGGCGILPEFVRDFWRGFLQKRAEGLNDRSAIVDLPDIISAVQKTLGVEVDGTAGPETWNAIYNRICRGKTGPPRKTSAAVSAAVRAGARNRVDDRSEKVIATLLPQVQPHARALVKKAAQHGITIKVIGGLPRMRSRTSFSRKVAPSPGAS